MKPHRLLAALTLAISLPTASLRSETHDVVIYGGTSAAVTAAVQAKRMGRSVIVVSPDKHLGGLSSGGLGWTDTGNKAVIGGLSREFYHRVFLHYDKDSSWTWQERAEYGNRGQGTKAIDGDERTMWIFEPHVAEQIFEDFVKEHGITVVRDEWLDRGEGGVTVEDGRIRSIRTLSGKEYAGKMFLDSTYEGDLVAAAGVSYHVGRESGDTYGEDWNGVQTGVLHHSHHFDAIPGRRRIDPYVKPGDPSSGVLPRISAEHPGEKGAGDHRVQAYCFRTCLTNHDANRVPFPKPDGYDPGQYELLVRIFEAGWKDVFHKFDPVPNHKTDTNNHGPMSSDNIGMNYAYPDASYEQRRAIIKEHEIYQKGWYYFIANDPRVPEAIRERMASWGLAKDEFTDNGNWPHQLYIREARRMVGHYVMTENELLGRRATPESVGMGSYTLDSHNVQRYITPEGYVQNEGDIGVHPGGPYAIAYGSLVPRREECQNLLVPVCVSSSHIAFGSIRMEPVFMILGQSAATAASHAIETGVAVQDIDYDKLKARLLADGQILEYTGGDHGRRRKGVSVKDLGGIVIDDRDAELEGDWKTSVSSDTWVGSGYRHDDAVADGSCTAVFQAEFEKPGTYQVLVAYTPNSNRATNVPVVIEHADGKKEILVNQTKVPPVDGIFLSVGRFNFDKTGSVTVTNKGTDGHTIIDGVQWLPVE